MLDWLTERMRAVGVIALFAMMTIFDSISKIISIIGDGILAIIGGILLYPWLFGKKRNKNKS